MTTDLSVIGMVFAIILFIVFLAAIILYLSFRIKETFREEKKRGMLIAKTAFLIGILFLAGGSLYFFAQILSPPPPPPTPPTNDTPPSNGTIPPNGDQTQKPTLSLFISYPSEVRLNTPFTITFTITNPTEATAHDVIIQTGSILGTLDVTSSSHEINGNIIEIGNAEGTTIATLELITKGPPGIINDTIALTFKEMDEPITKDIQITVKGGP